MKSSNEIVANRVKELLRHSPSSVLNQIATLTSEQAEFWICLAELTMQRADAVKASSADESKLWARIAIQGFDNLPTAGARQSAMALRVRMMQAHGVDNSSPLLSPRLVEKWFFENLNVELADAVRLSEEFRSGNPINVDVMRHVRDAKNRLSILLPLSGRNLFARENEIQQWQTIRKQLL